MCLVTALALTGCGAGGTGSAADSKADAPVARGANEAGAGKAVPGAAGSDGSGGRRAAPTQVTANTIIRTASLTVVVKDVPKALDDARATAETAGGYIGDETTTRDGAGHERTHVVLRVPTERYDQVLADLEGTGKVVERQAKAQDVTDQVVDVESRVKSQRASVARVRELMDKATKLSDVVTLEGELSSREADLEALLSRQASLKDRTSLATITLSLSETPVKKAEKKHEDPGFLDALSGGWTVLVTVVRWLALAIGAVLPFAAAVALIALVWLRLVRPRLPRRPSPAVAPGPYPTVAPGPSGGPAAAPAPSPVPASRPSPEGGEEH
jgi:Zn-ribbon protein, possibly nucleic acid-binding